MGSLDQKGFLSKDIQNWIEKHRKKYSDCFLLCDNLSSLGQRLMLSLELPIEETQKLLVNVLFARILSHFQGIVLLTERGMVAESRSLLRGMLDDTFSEVALSKHKCLVNNFLDDEHFQRVKALNSLISLPKDLKKKHLINRSRLKKEIENSQKEIDKKQIKPLTSQFLAQQADMLTYYNTWFVFWSSSTHSRVRDLEQYLGEDEPPNSETLFWGPDVKNLDEILLPACEILFNAIKAVSNLFNITEFEKMIKEQWIQFERLIGENS